MTKTSDRIIRSTHFLAIIMGVILLTVGVYLLFKTAMFTWDGIWQGIRLDHLIEGTIVRVLDTVIILEMIFVVINLDHKHHLNVGLALDVASTIIIRELILQFYSKADATTIYTLLIAIAVLVSLRVFHGAGKRKTNHE